jgi:hypothetical protein
VPVVAVETDDDYNDYDDHGKDDHSGSPGSVLDEELRVRGVIALRVVGKLPCCFSFSFLLRERVLGPVLGTVS